MKNWILLFGIAIGLVSCNNKKAGIADFVWLEGKWAGTMQGTEFFEEWQATKGNLMDGKGGAVLGKDTVFSEKIKIEQRGEDVFYTATVSENGGPVDFKLTDSQNDSIIFENPQHDFPQRVIYFRHPDGKLYACIDGKKSGAYSRLEFSFVKAK